MNVITQATATGLTGTVVAIGIFDGVHGGHRRVLARLRELGQHHRVPTLVLTFDPHPRALLNPQSAPKMLSSVADRIELLAATGAVDHCLVLPFDRLRQSESVEDFVSDTLLRDLSMRALVVGENFACGHGRRGNVELLRSLGHAFGFDVCPMRLRSDSDSGDQPHYSSTETRRLIECGNLRRAAILLGRPHQLTGRVISDAREAPRSSAVDLPEGMCVPPCGHYVGAVKHEGRAAVWIPAALQVLDGPSAQQRTVHFVADHGVGQSAGDWVRLSFLSNVSHLAAGFSARSTGRSDVARPSTRFSNTAGVVSADAEQATTALHTLRVAQSAEWRREFRRDTSTTQK